MAEVELRVGAKLNVLSPDEFRDGLDSVVSVWREQAKGVTWKRYASVVSPAVSAFTIPGPELGYAWDLKMISTVLSAADTMTAYLGEGPGARLIAAQPSATDQVLDFSSHQVIVLGGESVYLATSGTGNFTTMYAAAVQVPSERLGILIS